jgi:hypothetical protein
VQVARLILQYAAVAVLLKDIATAFGKRWIKQASSVSHKQRIANNALNSRNRLTRPFWRQCALVPQAIYTCLINYLAILLQVFLHCLAASY